MWTQGELAETANLSLYTVNAAEGGKGVSPKTGRALAEALGVEPRELLEEIVPKASAPQPSARAEQLWREPESPEISEEQMARITESLRLGVHHPEASSWVNVLNLEAESIERALERDDLSVEALMHAEWKAVELYALFREYRKSLLETSPPRLKEALQQADARMKSARNAVGEASHARRQQTIREAERDAPNVVRAFDEKLAQRKKDITEAAGA